MKAIVRNRLDHSMSVILSVAVNGILFLLLLAWVQQKPLGGPGDMRTTMVIDRDEPITPTYDPPPPTHLGESGTDAPDPFRHAVNTFKTDIARNDDPVDISPTYEAVDLSPMTTDNAGSVQLEGLMPHRSEKFRKQALDQYASGQGGRSEASVIKALQWLRDHQCANGAWNPMGVAEGSKNAQAGLTGLALLAFLAHGETPASAEYGQTVTRALRFLVDNQDARGIFQPAGAHEVYGHAIATYAIAEAYAMTGNIMLKEPMERAVNVILDGQQPNGGYDYDYKPSGRNDSSVAAWQIQALNAAKVAGATNANMDALLQRAMDGMLANSVKRPDGSRGFGYAGPGSRPSISAAGALCMQMLGRGDRQETKQTLAYLQPYIPDWGDSRITDSGGSLYFWYYAAQARFHASPEGRLFRDFAVPMVETLTENQNADGSWTDPTEPKHGPVMDTSLGALTLMVYYRHGLSPARPVMQSGVVAPADADIIRFEL